MKQFLFVALALLFVFFTAATVYKNTVEKNKIEVAKSIEQSPEIKLEKKEGYKLDNAEYKSAVAASGPSFSNELYSVGLFSLILGLVLLFQDISRRIKVRDVIVGCILLTLYIVLPSGQNNMVFAIFPVIPFYRDKDGGEGNGNDAKKALTEAMEEISKKNGEAITEAVKKEIGLVTKTLITPEVFKAEMEKLGIKEDTFKNLNEVITKHGNEINKIIKGEGKERIVKTIDEIVQENGEAIKKMAVADKSEKFKLRVKDPFAEKTIVNMATNATSTMGYRVSGMGQIAYRNLVMANLFTTVSLSEAEVAESNGVVRYMDVEAETNNAAEAAESATKAEAAINWKERSADFQVIANTIPVTRQAYRRLGFVASEIDRLLRKNHAIRKDTQLYSGDGIAPNIKGIYEYTTAAVLASLPNYQGLVDPNLYDLIANLRVYVANKSDSTGAQSKYNPNVVLMNPADVLKYKLAKAADGHYILPPFLSADGKTIDGALVVETPVVTANTLALGDSSYPTVYQSEDVVIEMGFINDQFVKNQWTIRAEQELLLLVRNADLGAFTKITDINAAIAALAIP